MALTFLVPVLLFSLPTAIRVAVIWGLSVLTVLSYRLARAQRTRPWKVIGEHLVIAVLVITLTHWLGDWVATTFE
jgi:VIT1/CCC1 family predicted Fe2+/Mn2+ transporter